MTVAAPSGLIGGKLVSECDSESEGEREPRRSHRRPAALRREVPTKHEDEDSAGEGVDHDNHEGAKNADRTGAMATGADIPAAEAEGGGAMTETVRVTNEAGDPME